MGSRSCVAVIAVTLRAGVAYSVQFSWRLCRAEGLKGTYDSIHHAGRSRSTSIPFGVGWNRW